MPGAGLATFVKATASGEAEARERTVKVLLSLLCAVSLVDVSATSVFFFLSCQDTELSTCFIDQLTGKTDGFSLKHGSVVCVLLAVSRPVVFVALLLVARIKGRLSGNMKPRRVQVGFGEELQESLVRRREGEGLGEEKVERRAAKWWAQAFKYCALGMIFAFSCAQQLYAGIKVSQYDWQGETTKTAQVVLLCLTVLWINLETYLSRSLAEELTREDGRYKPKIHKHPFYYDTNTTYWHYCDLCEQSIKIGGCWRCQLCDFDCCPACMDREDAEVVSENLLRTDKGVVEEKAVSGWSLLRRAIKISRPHAVLITTALIVLLLMCLADLALPRFQGAIIDKLVPDKSGKVDKEGFLEYVKIFFGVMMIKGLLSAIHRMVFDLVGNYLVLSVRNTLYEQLVQQDVAMFDGTTCGHLTSRLTYDVDMMMAPVTHSLSSVLKNTVYLVGGVAMCYIISYQLSMIAFVTVGPIMFLWDLYAKYSQRLSREMLAAWAEANSFAIETIGHIRTVKACATEPREVKRYVEANEQALKAGIRDAIADGVTTAVTGYLDNGTGVLILWFGGLLVMQQDSSITLGTLVTFQLYWDMMNSAYSALQGVVTELTRAAAGAEKVFAIWDNVADIRPGRGDPVDWEVKGDLELNKVSFFYQMRPDNIVLQEVSLKIPAGTTCALVGASGGGKSTVVNMLMRFYDPKKGKIMLDGRDYTTLQVDQLRKQFGIVAQETSLFAKSIRENLIYGLPGGSFTDQDIIEACKKAQAHDFIVAMKDGYETRIGERGGRISGGQKQRIAIARVFLQKPKLILLDEATSALDEESQKCVQVALDNLISSGKRTVIIVAHRLSTVQNADKIAVIDKGKVLEEGNHDELLKQGGFYAKLVKLKEARTSSMPGSSAENVDSIDALLGVKQKTKDDSKESDSESSYEPDTGLFTR